MDYASIYGSKVPGRPVGDIEPSTAQKVSGGKQLGTGQAPAFSWLAMIGLIVAMRLLWEYGG